MADHPLRDLPSVDALLGDERAADLVARHGRTATVEAIRAALADARAAGEPRLAEELLARAERLLERPPSLRPVLQRDRRDRAHEPGPRAAPGRGDRAGRARRRAATRTSSTTWTPARRGSRHAHLGPPAGRADGRRGRHGRQQQRRGGAAVPGGARRRARGADQPRRADRDRRRLPHPRHPRPVRRPARRGRHDQPHPIGGLRARAIGPDTGAHPPRPPVELPHGRLHGRAVARPSWPPWRPRTARR